MKLLRILLLALTVLGVTLASAELSSDKLVDQLQPRGYVNDFAGVLTASQRNALEQYLAELEQKTTVQVAVVAIPSLQGGEINDFTSRLFAKWGVGKKGKDNGVMILAAIQDRKARIEVGYGLESVIPDAEAGRILREQMFPLFKQGLYGEGLTRAAQAVAQLTAQNAGVQLTSAMPVSQAPAADSKSNLPPFSFFCFLAFFILIFVMKFYSRSGFWYMGSGGGFSGGGGFSSGGGFGGFGGGSSGGGGASGSW